MTNTFYKILTTTLQPTVNSAVFTDDFISEDSVIECFTTDDAYYPESADQSGNTVILTFKDHTGPLGVAIVVLNSLNNALEVTDEASTDVKKAFSASGAKVLSDAIDVNSSDIMDIFGDIGNLSELETVLKDNLVDAINELKAGIDSKSSVEVTQIQTEGTHIADIEVDGSTVELYAPEGGGGSGIIYDTTEHIIGKWFDRNVYRKLILYNYSAPSSATNFPLSKSDLNADFFINLSYINLDRPACIAAEVYNSTDSPSGLRFKCFDSLAYNSGNTAYLILDYVKVGE